MDLRLPARHAARDAVLRKLDERRDAHRDLPLGEIRRGDVVTWLDVRRFQDAVKLRRQLDRTEKNWFS